MSYLEVLEERTRDLVAMIHLPALPGTPRSRLGPEEILEVALAEARIYQHHGIHTVMIENMHDVPSQGTRFNLECAAGERTIARKCDRKRCQAYGSFEI